MMPNDMVNDICGKFLTCSDGCPFKVGGDYLCNYVEKEPELIIGIYNNYMTGVETGLHCSEEDVLALLND